MHKGYRSASFRLFGRAFGGAVGRGLASALREDMKDFFHIAGVDVLQTPPIHGGFSSFGTLFASSGGAQEY